MSYSGQRDYSGYTGGRAVRRDSDRSYDRRDSYGGSRSNSRSFSNSSRGSGRGGFGTGRQAADDSQTRALSNLPNSHFDELRMIGKIPAKVETPCQINAYGFSLRGTKKTYQYDIEFIAESSRNEEKIDLTSFKRREKQEVHSAMRELFKYVVSTNSDFFEADPVTKHCIVYDNAKILYSHKKMLEKGDKKEIIIDYVSVPDNIKDVFGRMNKIIVTVRLVAELDFSRISPNSSDLEVNRKYIQYFELLFSQGQISSEQYAAFGKKYFNKNEKVELDRTPFILKPGVERSVKIADGNTGNVTMLPKLKLFYPDGNMLDVCKYLADRDGLWRRQQDLSNTLKNVAVQTTHLKKNRVFRVFGLSDKSADETFFDLNGKQTSVAEYFETTHRRRLNARDAPLVIQKKGKERAYFPMEILRILPDQAVPKAKMSNDLNAKIIRKSQRLPYNFVEDVEKEKAAAKIQNADPLIKSSGIRLNVGKLNTVNSEQLHPPNIRYKSTEKELGNGIWGMIKDDEFIDPARIQRLMFVLSDRRLDGRSAEDFCQNLLTRARHYGMQIDSHQFDTWNDTRRDMMRLFDYAEGGVDFVFIIGDSDELHHGMKYNELKTKLVTQHIKTNTIRKANNSLFDNLVFKMNLKANGRNYELVTAQSMHDKLRNISVVGSLINQTMFFGIDLSHPGPQSEYQRATNVKLEDVTAVGFASNTKAGSINCNRGSTGYQVMRKHILDGDLLSRHFKEAVREYYRSNGQFPKWIVVYRVGVSEGEISKVREEEVPIFRQILESLHSESAEFNTKITIMVVNRKTVDRLVPKDINRDDRAPQQNCRSGTCVAEGFGGVPNQSFMLISQRALIGTANPATYTIVYDDTGLHMDCFKLLSYSLCFAHGIVTSPTALPAPLVSAADLSKRARNNFKTGNQEIRDAVKSAGDLVYRQNAGDALTEEEKMDIDKIDQENLNVVNEILRVQIENVRFWA